MKSDVKELLILVCIILAIFGFGYLLGWKNHTYSGVKPGKEYIHDTVRVHDTFTIKGKNVIVYKEKPTDTSASDSSSDMPPADTPRHCLSFTADTMGAHVEATACSKQMPPVKPLDLSTFFVIKLPDDTLRTKTRTDTAYVNTSKPILLDWRFYAAIIAAYFGGKYTNK